VLLLSYLIGLVTRAQGWWGVALVALIAAGIPIALALARRRKPEDVQDR
jgi:hypothetical protein